MSSISADIFPHFLEWGGGWDHGFKIHCACNLWVKNKLVTLLQVDCISCIEGVFLSHKGYIEMLPKWKPVFPKKREDINGSIHVINVYLSKKSIHVINVTVVAGQGLA